MHSYKAYVRVLVDKLYAGCGGLVNGIGTLVGIVEPIPRTRRVFGENSSLMHFSNLVQTPVQIDDRVILANAYDSADWNLLQEAGVKCIVNATRELSCYFEDQDIDYLKIPVLDDGASYIRPYFDEFLEFMDAHQGEKVLVHCYMGSSRSATLVLLYLVKRRGMTVDDGLRYLKEKRHFVNINERFLQEVRDYCACGAEAEN